jgi:hypothetical protein
MVGYVMAQVSGGGEEFGDGFYVKCCTNSDGSGTCGQAQADAYGYYQVTVPYQGSWWVFVWSDTYNWGSATQSIASGQVYVNNNWLDLPTRPRPSAPDAIYPPNNGWHIPYNTGFYLTWAGESDSRRDWPSTWPRTYDFWESSWFQPLAPLFTDLPGNQPYFYVGSTWLGPCTWYSHMLKAKMNVNVGNPGDPYYWTSGSRADWATNGPGC